MKNLIPMTDFVLEQLNEENSRTKPMRDVFKCLENYANLLKQPLELWMFVPCDENGGILEKPREFKNKFSTFEKYQQAKERCLFDVECIDISNGVFKGLQFKAKSFKMVEYNITTKKFFYGCVVVEDLIDYNLELTQTALKQLE